VSCPTIFFLVGFLSWVGNDGGITRSGNAEASEAEKDDTEDEKDDAPAVLGRGQRKRIAARHY
jgi:hypothetical protein